MALPSSNSRVEQETIYHVGVSTPTGGVPNYGHAGIGHVFLDRVRVNFYRGNTYQHGIGLLLAGQPILPRPGPFAGGNNSAPVYLYGDGEYVDVEIGLEVDDTAIGGVIGPGLTVVTINFGRYTHSADLYFVCRDMSVVAAELAASGEIATPAAGSIVTSGGGLAAAPVTQLQPPSTTTGSTTMTTTLAEGPTSTIDPNDPTIVSLQTQITQLQQQVETLNATVASLQQNLASVVATTPGPNPTPVTSVANNPPPSTGALQNQAAPGSTPTPGTTGPNVVLPTTGGTVPLSNGTAVNPYQPSGALDITALGKIAADNGGSVTITTPSGAQIPVTQGTLGGHPYTCIGTSC